MPIFSYRQAHKIQELCASVHKEKQVRNDLRFSQLLLEHIAKMNVLEEIMDDIHSGSVSRPHSSAFLTYTRAFAEGSDAEVLKVSEKFQPYAKRKDTAAVPSKDSTAYCYETTVGDLELDGMEFLEGYSKGMPVRKLFKHDSIIIDMLNAMIGEGFRVKKEEEMVASMGYTNAAINLFEVRLSVEFVGAYSPKDIALAAGVSRFSSVGRAIQDLPNVSIGFADDCEDISVLWPDSLYPYWLYGEAEPETYAQGQGQGAFDTISEEESEFLKSVLGEGVRL